MRRVRFEARVQALEIWSVMAQAMGRDGEHIPPEAMIAMMGGF